MQPEAKKLLWDVREAAAQVELFTTGRDLEDYLADAMLRSAVERQLEIVGEACSQLARVDGETASRVPEITRIIAFRNVLAHGYASVEADEGWSPYLSLEDAEKLDLVREALRRGDVGEASMLARVYPAHARLGLMPASCPPSKRNAGGDPPALIPTGRAVTAESRVL